MARHIKLADLVPAPDEPDTIEFPDGKVFVMPKVGIDAMANLLMVEETLSDDAAFEQLRQSKTRLMQMLREANPGVEVPDYDLTVDELMNLIVAFIGGDTGAIQTVRDALARDDEDEPASEEEARQQAIELGQAGGTREEDDDDTPLASPTPSRKRSSRSGTSGNGGRSGGKASAGRSSSRTSKKSSASRKG